jgi:hypothetical protein
MDKGSQAVLTALMMIYGTFFLTAILSGLAAWQVGRVRGRVTRRGGRVGLSVLIGLLIGVAALCAGAGSYATWYVHRGQPEPVRRGLFRGVEYVRDVRRSPRPMVIHVVTIDLDAPGLGFRVTPRGGPDGHVLKARKTSAFVAEFGVQVAINANYFRPFQSKSPWDYYPHPGDGVDVDGVAASRGDVYSSRPWREGTLYISADNRASFEKPVGAVFNAVSGFGFVVRNGEVVARADDDLARVPYPRAAVGLDKTARRMFFIVIDGKQPGYSEGATLDELGAAAAGYGVYDLVRLDEGGSCALAVEERPGRASLLNVPINHRIPYCERVVANHLGVFAEPMK